MSTHVNSESIVCNSPNKGDVLVIKSTMKPRKQREGMEQMERGKEPRRQHSRKTHSVPPSLHRSHSLPPRFVRNKWGSEETRKSYTCLCSLANNTECKRCISSATLSALDRYSLCRTRNPKWKSWWGNFLHLSSEIDIDASATDDD